MCFGCIGRPREGLRCYKGGHRRSRHAIREDGRLASQLHNPTGHGLWPFGPPVMRVVHHQHTMVPLVPEVMECTRFVLFPLVRRLGRSTTGIVTMRKVTIWRQLVVPSSSDDDLSLVKHDAQVDLYPGGTRICYTQEPAFLSDSPPPSPPPYIV
jgi:hypothetical protein